MPNPQNEAWLTGCHGLHAAIREIHDNSTINLEIGTRSQAACGSTQRSAERFEPPYLPWRCGGEQSEKA